jgi:hypothetical protein
VPVLRQYAAQAIEYAGKTAPSRPPCRWLTKFLFHFSMASPLFRRSLSPVFADLSRFRDRAPNWWAVLRKGSSEQEQLSVCVVGEFYITTPGHFGESYRGTIVVVKP